jgi:O-antigen ligase
MSATYHDASLAGNGLSQSASHPTLALWKWPAYVLFFLMLAFPMILSLLYVKAALFVFLFVCAALQGVKGLYLHRRVLIWTMVLSAVSLLFALRGLFLGAPGALKCIEVYAVWPLIYLLLLSGIRSMDILRSLEKILVFSTVFIGIFGAFYLLSELHVLPVIPYLSLFLTSEDVGSGFYEGHVELVLPGLGSLPFLVPFVIAAIVVLRSRATNRLVSRSWLSLALLSSLPIVLLSGRRALQVVTLLSPLLTLALGLFQPREERKFLKRSLSQVTLTLVLFLALAVPLFSAALSITFGGLAERFSSGFDFSNYNVSDSSMGRREQYTALLDGWMQAPLIGSGLGATTHQSIRSQLMPWAYELYYLDLLFQTGFVGFAAYTAGVGWIYLCGIRIIRSGGIGSQYMVPVLVGLSGFLIANATNPYLARFDGIWVIFLPLAFINHWLISSRKGRLSAEQRF